MDKLTFELTEIEDGVIRIVITLLGEVELGVLYYERAKKSFNRKPVGMNSWTCVDAKVEGLYVHGGENITPTDIMNKCQELIHQRMHPTAKGQ